MPRIHLPPSYRLHKARNSAVSTIDGENHYLGRYGSLESYRKYLDLLSGWITEKFGEVAKPSGENSERGLQIAELILAYWTHAKAYYVKRGQPTDEQACIRAALRPLRQLYGHKAVADFGPKDLKVVRESMIETDLCRRVINQYVERIKRMFRWGVENELVPPAVFHAITEVAGLGKGRSRARETAPVRPVPNGDVEAVLPFLSAVLRAMVEFQGLTGCRPGELAVELVVELAVELVVELAFDATAVEAGVSAVTARSGIVPVLAFSTAVVSTTVDAGTLGMDCGVVGDGTVREGTG